MRLENELDTLCRCVLDENINPFHRIARRRLEGMAFGVSDPNGIV